MWNCLGYQNHGRSIINRKIKHFFGQASPLSFFIFMFKMTSCEIRSDFTIFKVSLHSKGHPPPTPFDILSFPPPQSFPIGVLRAWSACVAELVCALLAASLVLFFHGFSSRSCSYKTHQNPYSTAQLRHTSFVSAPEHVACLFPKMAYQQTVWHQWTKLIFLQRLFFNRDHGSVHTCVYTWSDCLQCFVVRALHDIILWICCRAVLIREWLGKGCSHI